MTLILNGTSGLSDVDGSAATPAIRGTDANTGIFFPAADTIAFSEGGVESMRIDSSGNVGVGTTAPAARIVSASSSATNFKALILRNGDGTTGSSASIDFEASAGTQGDEGSMAGRIAGLRTGSGTSGALTFSTTNAGVLGERMRIDSSGNVGIGVISLTDNRLAVRGAGSTSTTASIVAQNGSGTSQFYLRNDNYFNSGAIANYSVAGTALVIDGSNFVGKTTSSLRYKKDIVDYDKGLTALESLRPVYYRSAVEGPNGVDPKQHAGFVAEEIADAGFEEFLVRDTEGRPDAVQYAHITALLVKSIKEQQAIIIQLQADVAALKAQP